MTLTVNDGNGGTATDTVVINVLAPGATPPPPAAALPDTLTSSESEAPVVALGVLLLATATWLAFALRRRRAVPHR